MTKRSNSLNAVFHALADPTRRSVVERLNQGPATVSELAEPASMALPTFVQHLRVLESCGLIRSQKVGRVRTCYANTAALLSAEQWISNQRALWERRLDCLEDYAKEVQMTEKENHE